MLTDKQILLCCGLLSLGLHLCSCWGMLNNNWQLQKHHFAPPPATIQVALIGAAMAPREDSQNKSQPAMTKDLLPVVAAAPIKPEIVPPTQPVKDIPHPATKTAEPQQKIAVRPPEKKRQKTLSPPPSEAVVITPAPEPLQAAAPHPLSENDFEVPVATVVNFDWKEIAVSGTEQVPDLAEAENLNKGEMTGEPGQGVEPSYLLRIRKMIEEHLDYPTRARRLHLSGEVNLRFNIGPGGEIDEILVSAESPHPILSRAAIRAVKQAAPFPQPQRKINVELPIQFTLN